MEVGGKLRVKYIISGRIHYYREMRTARDHQKGRQVAHVLPEAKSTYRYRNGSWKVLSA